MPKKTAVAKVPRLTKPTTAYKLLDKVCEVIAEEPRRYNQRQWIAVGTPFTEDAVFHNEYPACGTVCCVAGWIETLCSSRTRARKLADAFNGPAKSWEIGVAAAKTLGVSLVAAKELFDADAVPYNPESPVGSAAYAQSGVQHIRAFQKRHAATLKAKRVRPLKAAGRA